MSVPGIGAKGADKILELREAKGDLELDDLNVYFCLKSIMS
jgi:DNA uptake protein ComE-like DNA-binding protein